MWQDYVLMVGGFGFALALLPSVFSKSKPARSSCALTGGILATYCIVYATLGLTWGFISTLLTTIVWGILIFQKRS